MFFWKVAIFAIYLTVTVETANILGIFSYPSYSHMEFHRKVLNVLVEEGHNVTLFTSDPRDFGPNMTKYWFPESSKIFNTYTDMLKYKKTNINYSKMMYRELKAHYLLLEKEFNHPEIQRMIKNSSNYHFDLIIAECLMCPHFLLAEIFDCPIAITSATEISVGNHELFGNQADVRKFPESLILPYVHGKLTFLEKVNSIIFKMYQEMIFNFKFIIAHIILNVRFFSHLGEAIMEPPSNRLSLLILNTNKAVGHVRPMMPHSIQLGFIHIEKPKPIKDKELKDFLDKSTNGVILKTLGSRANGKDLGRDVIQKFINAFKMTNMSVLWKVDGLDDDIEIPNNVKIMSWIPQPDVLAHPNLKLLIFHGGIFSIYEAIDRLVPMIAFPMSYDQPVNGRILVDKGIGTQLDLNNFDEFELHAAMEEMIKPKYINNLKKARTLAYNQPISNRELLVWHVNNAIKHKLTYAKDFGGTFILGSPVNLILLYIAVFIGLLYLLLRKQSPKNKLKDD